MRKKEQIEDDEKNDDNDEEAEEEQDEEEQDAEERGGREGGTKISEKEGRREDGVRRLATSLAELFSQQTILTMFLTDKLFALPLQD